MRADASTPDWGELPLTAGEAQAFRARFLPVRADGVGGRQPWGYWFKVAGRRTTVTAWACSSVLDGDDRPATLVMRRHPRLVGARLPWSTAIVLLRREITVPFTDLSLVSDDEAYGFVVDSHGGYVPWELADEETVYEVARWRPLVAR